MMKHIAIAVVCFFLSSFFTQAFCQVDADIEMISVDAVEDTVTEGQTINGNFAFVNNGPDAITSDITFYYYADPILPANPMNEVEEGIFSPNFPGGMAPGVVYNHSSIIGVAKADIFDAFSDNIIIVWPVPLLPFNDPDSTNNYATDVIYFKGLTSTREITDLSNGILVYPNPSQGSFFIDYKRTQGHDIQHIEVSNAFGQIIMNTETSGTRYDEIDLSDFSNGLYLINFYEDDVLVGKKRVHLFR